MFFRALSNGNASDARAYPERIMNYLLFIAMCVCMYTCCAASPVVGTADQAAAFPSWVLGNHTACSACSHFQPIDVDAANAKAYARALQCNSSQAVVIVPGDTPVRTTRPLQMVRRAAFHAHPPPCFDSRSCIRSTKRNCVCSQRCALAMTMTAASLRSAVEMVTCDV